jgi:hypothetical protein
VGTAWGLRGGGGVGIVRRSRSRAEAGVAAVARLRRDAEWRRGKQSVEGSFSVSQRLGVGGGASPREAEPRTRTRGWQTRER